MFINTNEEAGIIEAPKGYFSCADLIRLCDNPDIVYQSGKIDRKCAVAKMYFFFRTPTQNLVVTERISGDFLFSADRVIKQLFTPDGMTLNDFMLMCAKELLVRLYDCKGTIRPLALFCMPTPFGLTDHLGYNTVVFQIVCDKDNLPPLKSGYTYTSIDNAKDISGFETGVKKQFKKTKD